MDPPDPLEVTDFRFTALRKILLSSPSHGDGPVMDMVACVPGAGLVLVGGDSGLHILTTKEIEEQDRSATKVTRGQVNTSKVGTKVDIPGKIVSIGVSCDGLVVSGVVQEDGAFPICYLWDTRGLSSSPPDLPFTSISLNTAVMGTKVTGVAWNPAFHHTFCVTLSDGSVAMYTVKEDGDVDCVTLPPAAQLVVMSWSPKGKQIVGVKRDGSLTQYKPDLREARTWAGPPTPPGLLPVSLTWLSTYEFLVGYRDPVDGDKYPGIWLVKGSKAGTVEYIFYDDVCYSTGPETDTFFSCQSLPDWSVIVVASSGSLELGVLGSKDGCYSQWILEDNARAELPLDDNNDERYPVGMAINYTGDGPPPKEQGELPGPPTPLLYLLSSNGLLCPYYCINNAPTAPPPSCKPPTPLSTQGKREGTVKYPTITKIAPTVTSSIPLVTSTTQPTTIFNLSTTSAGNFAQSTPVKPFPTSGLFKPPTSEINITKASSTPPTKAITPGLPFAAIPQVKSSSTPLLTQLLKKETPPPEKSPAASKEVSPSPIDNTNIKISAAIDEEFKAFESELSELRESLSSGLTSLNIGSKDNKVALVTRAKIQSEFCRDLIETTKCQNSEIHDMKTSTLESFSWLEEAKSRDTGYGDTRYLQLLRARPLDPRSQRRLDDLRAQFLYCEQQVDEIGCSLDIEWEDHVSRLQRTVRGPTSGGLSEGERLAQAVLTNHSVIDRQKETVGELSEKVAKLVVEYPVTLGNRPGRGCRESLAETELDKLAENLRDKSTISVTSPVKTLLNEISVNTTKEADKVINTPVKVLPTDHVVSPVKSFSHGKELNLKKQLDGRNLTVTRCTSAQPHNIPKPDSAKLLGKLKEIPAPSSKISSFKAGSITVELSAGMPVVYEPISPAAKSPKKDDAAFSKKIGDINSSAVKTLSFGASKSTVVPSTNCFTFNSAVPVVSSSSPKVSISIASPFSSKDPSPVPSSFHSSTSGSPAPDSKSGSSSSSSDYKPTLTSKSVTATSTSRSIFGGTPATGSETGSAFTFGNSTSSISLMPSTTSSSKSMFNILSTTTTTTSVSGSSFGMSGVSNEGTAIGSGSSSIFGGSSAFGKAATSLVSTSTTSSSVFGAPLTTPSTTKSSLFGSSAMSSLPTSTSVTTESSIFGKAATTLAKSSVLGKSSSSSFVLSEEVVTSAESSVSEAVSASSTPAAIIASTSSIAPVGVTSTLLNSTTTSISIASSVSVFGTTTSSNSTKQSIFGETATSTGKSSMFGATAAPVSSVLGGATTTTGLSVFGASVAKAPESSFFGSASSTSGSSLVVATSTTAAPVSSALGSGTSTAGSSVFGSTTTEAPVSSVFGSATSSTGSSVFGAASTSAAPVSTVFGSATATTNSSVFGDSSTITAQVSSVIGSATSSAGSSLFVATSTTAAPVSSVFGGAISTTGSSAFGATSTTAVPVSSVFASATSTTGSSVFGSTPITETPLSSVFASATSTTGSSVFGVSLTTAAPVSSVFGSDTTISKSSVFVDTATTSAPVSSVFGGATTTSGSSVFGATSAPSSSSVFGGAPTSSSSSVFGAASSSAASVFGAVSTTSSAFGISPASSTPSVLGKPEVTATKSSIFGSSQSTPTTSSTSIFGGESAPASSLFGSSTISVASSSVFGSSATTSSVFGATQPSSSGFGAASTTSTTPSVFGGAPPSSSVFGGSSSIFGSSTPVSSASVFGASTPTTSVSVFGGASSSATSVFGSVGESGGGGGFLGGLGGSASSGSATKNPFGGDSTTFGSSGSGIFGGGATGGAGVFGGGATGGGSIFGGSAQQGSSSFGVGNFSDGGNVTSSGFGVGATSTTPAKPASAFGGAPAFGSPPSLGAPSAFGASPGFGSAPAFGSSAGYGGGATFGATAGSGASFGSAASSGSTFGSMTSGATPGFGSMSGSNAAFGAGAAPSSGFGSTVGSAPAFGSAGSTSPPPAGQQFNSWR